MKLISCYVSSFGKLKDFSFNFDSGLNTIKQENGWGKTTLSTFIKAMFYGINSSKRSISENERIKYKPWTSTEKFGGYIEFEWGEKVYKIERFFGNKESEDTVRLFDVQTGKEFANTENLGKRIFEIDEEGFLSTTYMSQKDFEIKSNSSLTAKYNSVCEIQDTEAFDKALNKLEEKAKLYKYRGDKGLITDIKREILELDEDVEITQKSERAAKLLKEEVEFLEKQVIDLKEQGEQLTNAVAQAGTIQAKKIKKEHFDTLIAEKEQHLTKLKEIEVVLGKNRVAQEEIDNYVLFDNELIALNSTIDKAKKDIFDLKESRENEQKVEKPNQTIFLILSAVLVVVGGALAFLQPFVGLAVSIIGVVGFIVTVLSKNKGDGQSNSVFDDLITQKQTELENLLQLQASAIEKVDQFIEKFNLIGANGRYAALTAISKANLERENLEKALQNIDVKLKEYDAELINYDESAESEQNIDILNQKLAFVQNEFSKSSHELANKKASLVYHENIANGIVDIESKRADLVSKLSVCEEEYKLLTTTVKFLKQADENLKVKYREPLQQSLDKYLTYIDGKRNANIDVDLKLTINENGVSKEVDYYSKGYQNLYDICKRFALTDVLFTGEKPFIILDDPFYNLDDEKLNKALELIKNLSQEYQIIYLVCHESRRG